MASILVRALDADGDIQWGQGKGNFLVDSEAVAQLIATRLRLNQGEWWADKLEGLPLWQKILGASSPVSNAGKIGLLIQKRVQATPFVTGMSGIASKFDPRTRVFSYSANVHTEFGMMKVTTSPSVPAQGLSK